MVNELCVLAWDRGEGIPAGIRGMEWGGGLGKGRAESWRCRKQGGKKRQEVCAPLITVLSGNPG